MRTFIPTIYTNGEVLGNKIIRLIFHHAYILFEKLVYKREKCMKVQTADDRRERGKGRKVVEIVKATNLYDSFSEWNGAKNCCSEREKFFDLSLQVGKLSVIDF